MQSGDEDARRDATLDSAESTGSAELEAVRELIREAITGLDQLID